MKLRTRIVSAFVACLMLVSLLPTTVFAAEAPVHTTHVYSIYVSTLDSGSCKDGTPGIGKYQCEVEGCTKTTYKSMPAQHKKADDASAKDHKDATCGVDGYDVYACETCTEDFTMVIPASGEHTEKEGVVAATCTEPAKVGKVCGVCGIQLGEAEEVPGTELGHDFKMTVIKKATCEESGSQQVQCTRCDATQGAVETIPAPGHDWQDVDDGMIPADCDNPARMPQVCGTCEATQTIVITLEGSDEPAIPALGHQYGEAAKTDATCVDPAYITKTCSRDKCGHVDKQVDTSVNNGQALGHDWKTTKTVAANCTDGGYEEQTCQRANCGKTQKINESEPVSGAHEVDTENSTVLSEADCSKLQNAIYKAVCKHCKASLGYKSVPYEHNFEGASENVVTAATCTTGGTATVQCQNKDCTFTKTINTDPTGHSWKKIADEDGQEQDPDADGWVVTKAATCGATGLKSRDCEKCDEADATDVTILATEKHEYEDRVIEATCQHPKQAGSFCKHCDAENPDEEPVDFGEPVGHSYTEKVEAASSEATCTAAGKTVMKCKWCDLTQETPIPAKGHTEPSNSEEIEVLPGDCKTAMKLKFHCTGCDQDVTIDVDDGDFEPKDHTWTTGSDTDAQGWKVTKAASCTETGTKERVCSACGTKETETIQKTAHTTIEKKVDATCEAEGYSVLYCTTCKMEQGDHYDETPVNASKHVYDEDKHDYLQEPTCTENGVEIKICTNCGKRSYVAAVAGHDWNEGAQTQPPTCTEKGVKTYTCKRDNCPGYVEGGNNGDATGKNDQNKATKTEDIAVLGHDWIGQQNDVDANGWKVTKEPTCGEEGEKTRTCQRNGCVGNDAGDGPATETDTIDATNNHDFQEPEVPMIPATCTENGKAAGWTCSQCGADDPDHPAEDLGDLAPATGHTWTKWVTPEDAENSCAEDAEPVEEYLVCNNCDAEAVAGKNGAPDVVTRTLDKPDHEMDPEDTTFDGKAYEMIEGDCEHSMGIKFICKGCGATITEYIDDDVPGTHTWSEDGGDGWNVTKEAECGVAGSKTRTCSVCKKTETEVIPALVHDTNGNVKTVAATCDKEGYTIATCSKCGEEQGEKLSTLPVDSSAHVYDDNTHDYLQRPTCTEAGVERKTCTKCGKSTYVKADPSHTYDEGKETTAPGCETTGVKTYTCSVCDAETEGHTKTESIPAKGHAYSETKDAVKSVEATCGAAGKDVFVCTNNCGIDKEVPVKATGEHTWGDSFTQATCTAPAMAGQVCETCKATKGEMEPVEGSEALGHDWGDWGTVTEADCHEDEDGKMTDGTEKRTCKRDGCKDEETGEAAFETRTVKAKHTPGTSNYQPATCTKAGHVVTKCDKCQKVLEDEDLTDVAPALGHKPKVNKQDATCTEDGWTETVCEREGCGVVLSERTTIPANGDHVYEIKVIQESTCTAKGIGRPTCKHCGATKSFVALELAKHKWGEDYAEGMKVYHKCDTCGTVELVQDLGNPDPDEPGDETCEHEWAYEDETNHKCGNCEDTEAHKWGSEYQNDDGTAMMKKCSVCNHETKVRDITPDDPCKDGHSWDPSNGTCSECGTPCEHSSWNKEDGTCNTCGMTCKHSSWNEADGTCKTCGMTCAHSSWNKEDGTCNTCGMTCAHDYQEEVDYDDMDDEGNPGKKWVCSKCHHETKNNGTSENEAPKAEEPGIE